MSKGHGQRQRDILDRLTRHAIEAPALGDFEADGEPFPSYLPVSVLAGDASRSAVEATRRAVLRLETEGRVHTMYVRKRHPGGQMQLCARLVVDDATETEWKRQAGEHQAERKRQRDEMRASLGL